MLGACRRKTRASAKSVADRPRLGDLRPEAVRSDFFPVGPSSFITGSTDEMPNTKSQIPSLSQAMRSRRSGRRLISFEVRPYDEAPSSSIGTNSSIWRFIQSQSLSLNR